MTAYGDILWNPGASELNHSHMAQFARIVSARSGLDLHAYADLQRWSIAEPAAFWRALADYTAVDCTASAQVVFTPPPPGKMLGGTWFPGARLNYAEHLLAGADRPAAVVALAEGAPRRSISLARLRQEVARCAAALHAWGVGPGDRVAGVMANIPETVIAMLATTSLGAVWSSCSPDFGAPAVRDRFAQVEPKVIFCTTAYVYGGKRHDCLASIESMLQGLPSVEKTVLVTHLEVAPAALPPAFAALAASVSWWDDALDQAPLRVLSFVARDFNDPLFIMFSSGTTGVPKAIVHGIGGTLLQHKKELMLHSDIGPESRLLFYTTCGWMMWNWSVSALATGASLVLFEGSVAAPDLGVLWRAVRDLRVTALGTSPKFIATCISQGLDVRQILSTQAPKTILATGAPLLPEHFAWLYAHVPPSGASLHVASISGGTDIISCFMLGSPTLPVRAGEIQCVGLGMAVEAWDEQAQPVCGIKAELVCTQPFPAMPLGFWHDSGGERYYQAYFAHFQAQGREVWRHGDFVEITANGGVIVYGRSDATLNPGGVRIGTAELYRQVESLGEVVDSVAVAHRAYGDEAIILFVKLAPGLTLDGALTSQIKASIKQALTPRHVPKEVVQVRDIPYTRSGKKVELAVTQVLHGETVLNLAAIGNPEALDDFIDWAQKSQHLPSSSA